jgi:hypothetical protein
MDLSHERLQLVLSDVLQCNKNPKTTKNAPSSLPPSFSYAEASIFCNSLSNLPFIIGWPLAFFLLKAFLSFCLLDASACSLALCCSAASRRCSLSSASASFCACVMAPILSSLLGGLLI